MTFNSSSEMRDDWYYAMGALIIFLLLEPDKAKHIIFGTRWLFANSLVLEYFTRGKSFPCILGKLKNQGVFLDPQLTFDEYILKTTSSCLSSLSHWDQLC